MEGDNRTAEKGRRLSEGGVAAGAHEKCSHDGCMEGKVSFLTHQRPTLAAFAVWADGMSATAVPPVSTITTTAITIRGQRLPVFFRQRGQCRASTTTGWPQP